MTREELRRWREAQGVSQRIAADTLAVARVTYCQWEQGHHAIPRWVERLTEALEIVRQTERRPRVVPEAESMTRIYRIKPAAWTKVQEWLDNFHPRCWIWRETGRRDSYSIQFADDTGVVGLKSLLGVIE